MIPTIEFFGLDIGKHKKHKTNVWSVWCNEKALGLIKWYSPWRCYVFYPHACTLFDTSCLQQITDFIANEMIKRKAA